MCGSLSTNTSNLILISSNKLNELVNWKVICALFLLKIHTAIDGIEAGSFICSKQQQVAYGSQEQFPIRILTKPNNAHLWISSTGRIPTKGICSQLLLLLCVSRKYPDPHHGGNFNCNPSTPSDFPFSQDKVNPLTLPNFRKKISSIPSNLWKLFFFH